MNTPTSPPLAAPPVSLLGSLPIIARDIKLAHTVFAMPFAMLGAFLARAKDAPWPRFFGQLGLIIVCMVLARTWAMLVNRLADRNFDYQNARTSRRAFASGRLDSRTGWRIAGAIGLLFFGAASAFWFAFHNPWPARLALPVLALLAFYSYTKRFTLLCHIVLGVSLAASPLAAAIAIDPAALSRTPALFWLSGMVASWVAGFDIIYALQDIEFDRGRGLRSIPGALGWRNAINVSRLLHAAAALFLFIAYRSDPRLGPLFLVAAVLATCLLIAEHIVLSRRGQAGLDMAFFTLNGFVSCIIGALGIADLLL